MICVAICDDEQEMSEQIRLMAAAFFRKKNREATIVQFSRGEDVLHYDKQIDILFLDIQMEGIDGIETVRRLRNQRFGGFLIFITILKELVFQSFEVGPYDYLVKPVEEAYFVKMMERLFFSMQNAVEASLFCMLFAYQKLLQSFRLSTEVSLLEQEERSLNQYVEEARVRYEKTASFRHDIKNHLTMIKKLLQNGMLEQAFTYMGEIEEELSFPCSTNNLVIDILIGNKLGIAKNRGIDVCCSLLLPYPCRLRDIDLCIIFSI